MSVLNWDYEYAELAEGEGQYDNINLRNVNCVDAVYIPAEFSIDKGNPFIEALPRPREGSDVRRSYNRQIIGYNADEVANMSDYKRIRAISLLRSLRFPLPFDERLETTIYNTLAESYRNRKLRGSFDTPIKYKANDEDEETFGSLKGRKDDAANAGFSLIGYSGCGKSTALGFAFDHIPQVIYHNANGCRIPQIVYLNVSCFHNNNMSALYIGIGAACNNTYGRKTAGGFMWRYSDEVSGIENIQAVVISDVFRAINQYDLDGRFIRQWKGISVAEKELGIRNISEVCHGHRGKSAGYMWRFADVETREKIEPYRRNHHVVQDKAI